MLFTSKTIEDIIKLESILIGTSYTPRRYTQLKKYFSRCMITIGFLKRGINLIFSKIKEGDNIVFSPLHSENDLNIRGKLI
jgi:hypothetical protein